MSSEPRLRMIEIGGGFLNQPEKEMIRVELPPKEKMLIPLGLRENLRRHFQFVSERFMRQRIPEALSEGALKPEGVAGKLGLDDSSVRTGNSDAWIHNETKNAYETFLRRNGLSDVESSYSAFMLSALHEQRTLIHQIADANTALVTPYLRKAGLTPEKYRADLLVRLAITSLTPFHPKIQVSKLSNSGTFDPSLTAPNRFTSVPLLEFIRVHGYPFLTHPDFTKPSNADSDVTRQWARLLPEMKKYKLV